VISFEKLLYTLSNLNGTLLATELKENNPNAVRKLKRFFASGMQLATDPDKEYFLKEFTVQDTKSITPTSPDCESRIRKLCHGVGAFSLK
jgi:hypothetical protein